MHMVPESKRLTERAGEGTVKSLAIVGAGGFGREVLEIFKAQNAMAPQWNILGFIDDNTDLRGKVLNGYPVLGGVEWLRENNRDDLRCVCAIGDCEIRKTVVERVRKIGVRFCNAIHPSVMMSEFVELGEDVILCAGSILTVNIRIGDHVHVNLNSYIGHDSVINSYCTISPMVSVGGENHFGEGVLVGIGAKFIQHISVGEWSTIGAGAVVTKDIPERAVAVGVPARVIKRK